MIKIKQKPEHFIVKEKLKLNLKENGQYTYYLLKKTDLNTIDAVNKISDRLNLSPKYINFAGTKDRKAITEQYISISKGPKKDLYLDGIELKYLGEGDERINLGSLEGNNFEITIETDQELRLIKKTINYFDDQRFGMNKNNHVIGKLLVQKKFKEACEVLMINAEGNNYVGALKKLHKKILQLYVHAYQSYLWNETLSTYLKNQNQQVKEVPYSAGTFIFIKNPEPFLELNVPLIGFASEDLETNEQIKEIIHHSMLKENISYRDFIIKQIPELSSEGGTRTAFIEVKELKIEDQQPDELTPGKNKIKISFILGKGSYATLVIKKILNTLK